MHRRSCLRRSTLAAAWWTAGVVLVVSACSGRPSAVEETGAEGRLLRAGRHLQQALVVEGLPLETWSIEERMEQFSVPGVSAAVVDGGRLVAARAWGVKVAGQPDPVTTETLFQAGSLSKPVTALVALTLVDEGLLGLDRPINDVLRSWKVPENELTRRTPVTLRHLLSHQAGFTRFGYLIARSEGAVPSMAELLRGGIHDWPTITVEEEPGTSHAYSNSGYCVLQMALEDVTDLTLHELAAQQLFRPLEISHSRFDEPLDPATLDAAAAGHTRQRGEDGSRGDPVMVDGRAQMAPAAAGGLWSTPSDLGRLVEDVLRARHDESPRALTAEIAEAYLTLQVPGEGLGIHLDGVGTALRARHAGAMVGFVAHLVFYPASGQGAVVMSNSDGGSLLNHELIAAIAAEFQWPGYPVRRRLGTVSSQQLAPLVAVYESDAHPGVTFTVRREGNTATGQVNDYPRFELTPTDVPDRFVLPSRSLEIVFERDDAGSVDAVTLGTAGEGGTRYSRRRDP
jgi:CubicO group peptidase (beta-lactamase class C family)